MTETTTNIVNQPSKNMEGLFVTIQWLIAAAAIVGTVCAIMWAIVSFEESGNQRQVDIVDTCQQAEDPEVCQALA